MSDIHPLPLVPHDIPINPVRVFKDGPVWRMGHPGCAFYKANHAIGWASPVGCGSFAEALRLARLHIRAHGGDER
jgi:hypothetical protein